MSSAVADAAAAVATTNKEADQAMSTRSPRAPEKTVDQVMDAPKNAMVKIALKFDLP